MKTWLAALAALFVSANGAAAMVGASEAGGPLERHVVMLLKRDAQGAGFCSAVLLDDRTLLTAAHCVGRPQDLRAHFRADGKPVMLDVAAVATHPDYRADALKTRARSVDLALVRLATPLPARYEAANLSRDARFDVGARLRVAGYGVTREGAGETGGQFRSALLAVRAPLGAILVWLQAPDGGRQGACTGDSGGPIFTTNGEIAAITAWSTGPNGKGCGGITQGALVAPQRSWIDKVRAGWR